MSTQVTIRELAGWDLDVYPWREHIAGTPAFTQSVTDAKHFIATRTISDGGLRSGALLLEETERHKALLASQRMQPAMQDEMHGLDWSLGAVDLRRLIAFQRRLVLDPEHPPVAIPQQHDWQELCDLAFAGQRSLRHDVCRSSSDEHAIELRLHSWNPDLRIVQSKPTHGTDSKDALPLRLTGGSPFFEVASYRGRWFLRDGYHRAFAMLRAGVQVGFAVVVAARTLEELGAVGPWFFGEETLFSNRPPMVTDFLRDACVLQYDRPRLRKTITVRIEESLEPHQDSNTNRTPQ
jgi:hypothetical protein